MVSFLLPERPRHFILQILDLGVTSFLIHAARETADKVIMLFKVTVQRLPVPRFRVAPQSRSRGGAVHTSVCV